MNKPLYLFANWKMYLTVEESVALATALKNEAAVISDNLTVAVFPSTLAFTKVAEALDGASYALGAQNSYWLDKGGYTGEVSAFMYKTAGASYVLVGHSERRHVFHESNREVRQKVEGALAADVTPVLCVGETLRERKDEAMEVVVETQLRSALTDIAWPETKELIIAYEPVWAVNTGESCPPDEAARMAALIYKFVKGLVPQVTPCVLYGGSVRGDNVQNYLQAPYIGGVLVGGASTKFESWKDIVNAAQ